MPIKWNKRRISEETYEAAGIFDVNNDGIADIISGAWWYEGPDYTKRHKIRDVQPVDDYYDDFSNIPLDINGDGWTDYVTGAWFGAALRWHENPGDPDKEWNVHIIDECGNIERACAWDVDGDGTLEIVPNTPGGPLAIFKLKIGQDGKGTGEFTKHIVRDEPQGHGLGGGDIAGNGRCDLVLNSGWLEAPADPYGEEWTWHPEFKLFDSASTPIIVADVTGNGLGDIIVGGGHEYGLTWLEQKRSGDSRTWVPHPIDPFNSQYHDMMWIDVDGDGMNELVTGTRYRAHCGNDPGADDDVGIYYFKWNGEAFSKQVIEHGPAGVATGCGIYFAMADLTGNGLPDLVAPGKDCLYLFENLGEGGKA
jgi:hypothetical protein